MAPFPTRSHPHSVPAFSSPPHPRSGADLRDLNPLIRPGCVGKEVYLDDLTAIRNEALFAPPRFVSAWLERNLNDARDMEIAVLLFNIAVTMWPAAILLFVYPSHILGGVYFALFNALYLQRFILAMHYSTHRRLFKPGSFAGETLNRLNICLYAPMFGIPCNTYRLHHIVMHHVDNNEWNKDLSATEAYQRDNVLHWVCYWVRFMVGSWVELPFYALIRKRWNLFAQVTAGFALTLSSWYAAWHCGSAPFAVWTCFVPFLAVSTALMFGNWSQHAFVCPVNPRCNYRLTYAVLNHPDNQRSYNDGFHTLHHANSMIHWSEFPAKFIEKLDEHAARDALVFNEIGFFHVGLALFFKAHGYLADHYVNVGQPKRTREELIALMKERLRPMRSWGDKDEFPESKKATKAA